MKQTRFLILAVLCLLVASVAKADDTPIPVGQLPAAAKTFVQANFPAKKIIYAEKDWNSYECRLNDGTKIEFNKKGAWKKVDCQGMTAVPAAYGYEIELSNDVDLKFNNQGQIIGFDD